MAAYNAPKTLAKSVKAQRSGPANQWANNAYAMIRQGDIGGLRFAIPVSILMHAGSAELLYMVCFINSARFACSTSFSCYCPYKAICSRFLEMTELSQR